MKFKWRKWNNAIHRDLGYIFFAMTVIYSLSGIAVNHLHDWNPNYKITLQEVNFTGPLDRQEINKEVVNTFLDEIGEETYKKHYFPTRDQLKIFIDGGNVVIDLSTGQGYLEKIERRPLLHAVNYLHYNPGKWWTLFSDIFAGALIILSITGLFILRGKNGITRRGAVLTAIGIIIPLIYLIIFYQ
jgi:hypothetical protein